MDYLKRKSVIQTVQKMYASSDGEDKEFYRDLLIECFKVLPAAGNVREMVYCEDCKWGEEEYNGKYHCVYHGVVGNERYFYCRDGKWKDE